MRVVMAPETADRARLGVLLLDDVTVRPSDEALSAEIGRTCRELRERYAGRTSGEVPGVAEARSLYKAVGLDPTKVRPSNEALLRRALKGEALHRVNTLVDALNLCSLRFQLPFGLYDRDRLAGGVEFRRGRPGEGYEGIRKGWVGLEGRPLLADELGPFGNPSSDSARTCVGEATRRALVVLFAPRSASGARLDEVLAGTSATLCAFCGGRETLRLALPAPSA